MMDGTEKFSFYEPGPYKRARDIRKLKVQGTVPSPTHTSSCTWKSMNTDRGGKRAKKSPKSQKSSLLTVALNAISTFTSLHCNAETSATKGASSLPSSYPRAEAIPLFFPSSTTDGGVQDDAVLPQSPSSPSETTEATDGHRQIKQLPRRSKGRAILSLSSPVALLTAPSEQDHHHYYDNDELEAELLAAAEARSGDEDDPYSSDSESESEVDSDTPEYFDEDDQTQTNLKQLPTGAAASDPLPLSAPSHAYVDLPAPPTTHQSQTEEKTASKTPTRSYSVSSLVEVFCKASLDSKSSRFQVSSERDEPPLVPSVDKKSASSVQPQTVPESTLVIPQARRASPSSQHDSPKVSSLSVEAVIICAPPEPTLQEDSRPAASRPQSPEVEPEISLPVDTQPKDIPPPSSPILPSSSTPQETPETSTSGLAHSISKEPHVTSAELEIPGPITRPIPSFPISEPAIHSSIPPPSIPQSQSHSTKPAPAVTQSQPVGVPASPSANASSPPAVATSEPQSLPVAQSRLEANTGPLELLSNQTQSTPRTEEPKPPMVNPALLSNVAVPEATLTRFVSAAPEPPVVEDMSMDIELFKIVLKTLNYCYPMDGEDTVMSDVENEYVHEDEDCKMSDCDVDADGDFWMMEAEDLVDPYGVWIHNGWLHDYQYDAVMV